MDCDSNSDDDDDDDDMPSDNEMDPDYHPDEVEDHIEYVDLNEQRRQPQHESKYIVFRSMLLLLLSYITCRGCGSRNLTWSQTRWD